MKRIPDNIVDLAKDMAMSGSRLKDIAAEVGYCRHAIAKALIMRHGFRVSGLYRKAHNAREFDRDDMVRRYLSGESILALSKELKCCRATIANELKRRNIDARNDPLPTPSECPD